MTSTPFCLSPFTAGVLPLGVAVSSKGLTLSLSPADAVNRNGYNNTDIYYTNIVVNIIITNLKKVGQKEKHLKYVVVSNNITITI